MNEPASLSRRASIREMQAAVRAYAREPSVINAANVEEALRRVRMLNNLDTIVANSDAKTTGVSRLQ